MLVLPRLRTDQAQIVGFGRGNQANTAVVAMGRRWGKSTMAGAFCTLASVRGAQVAWVVPTYKNGRPLWRNVERYLAPLERVKRARLNKSERTAEIVGGGFLGIYSADNPTSILGEAFHLVVIDEAARIAEEVWTDTIQPTLADYSGKALLISTPKGRNWFWREWVRGRDGDPSVRSFQAPSADNPNPRIKAAAELAKTRVPERTYRQEWLAEFIDDSNDVFRGVRQMADAEPQDEAIEGHQYVIGADWAQSQDYTVFAVVDSTLGAIVHIDRFTDTDYGTARNRLFALWQRFGECAVVAEQNGIGLPIIEELWRSGMPVQPFTTTNASKAEAVGAVVLAFEQRKLHLINHEPMLLELEIFESERTASGLIRYAAPAGFHDDIVMAICFAWSIGQYL
jgi:hypothetical protein